MAAATIEGAGASASEEADVVNPIVFFDITLGGEFFLMKIPPLLYYYLVLFQLFFLLDAISP